MPELMPRLAGARTWKDDEKLECVSVVPDGPNVVSFSFRAPSGAWFDYRPGQFLTLEQDVDSKGVRRFPIGASPILDPATGETLVDALGRRSFTTSMAYGPTIGKTIMLAYLPHEHAVKGNRYEIEYFGERYPVEVAGVGYAPLYDPENLKPRS